MSLVVELNLEQRYEDCRDNIGSVLQAMTDDERFRRVAILAFLDLANKWKLEPTEAAKQLGISNGVHNSWSNDDFNRLFCDSVAGAKSSANLYSLIETAKANKIEPYRYLRKIITELPKASSLEHIEALLPFEQKPAYDEVV